MRSSPFLGFIVLIVAAVIVAGFASKVHPNRGSLPPAEQAIEDERQQREAAQKQAEDQKSGMMTFEQAKEGATKVALEIQGRGTMILELYPKAAPQTVAHFVDLCKKHFYDGLKFHRVVPGFVIQGGDPHSKDASVAEFDTKQIGSHGSGQNVPLEAKLPHTQYSVGLARSDSLNSGDSQFYINLKDNNNLDGKYCVFGMVTQGQEIAAKVQKGDVIKSMTLP